MDGERIARLGALDIERSSLWVDEGVFANLGEQIFFRADAPAETVLGVEIEDFTRLDASHRIDTAEGPVVLLLGRDDPLDLDGFDLLSFFAVALFATVSVRVCAG